VVEEEVATTPAAEAVEVTTILIVAAPEAEEAIVLEEAEAEVIALEAVKILEAHAEEEVTAEVEIEARILEAHAEEEEEEGEEVTEVKVTLSSVEEVAEAEKLTEIEIPFLMTLLNLTGKAPRQSQLPSFTFY